MKIKTNNLTGPALDWAVAKCEGLSFTHGDYEYTLDGRVFQRGGCSVERRYSTNWSQGGPIIDREKIDCVADPNGKDAWMGQLYATRLAGNKVVRSYGPTPLVAAMRCYVAYKLGAEVDVPEELL
jgi:hypothetical protein